MSDLTGRSLGRYHILERLGEGGMAIVYKAYDTRLEREVAVKIIRRGAFPSDHMEHILKRFEREAKSLAKLSHPNIVGVIDYGEYEGSPYLVMVYLPGGTLKQRIGKPIPWQNAVQLLIPIAQALEYAHEHYIIHRDIKPSNILLTEKGQPMLTDFGVAKILDTDETATLTGTGIGIGTPEYMAPEQWIGQTVLQSDIYSLGVVLYEMITGRKPYVADTPAAILLKLASDPLPKPTQFIPNLPDAVEKILIKALAKKAGDRYPTVTEFVTALERLTYQTEKVNFPKQTTPIERGTFQQRSNVIPDKKPQVALRIPPNVTLVQEPPKNISGRIWIGIGGIGLLVCVITGMLIVLAKMSFPSTYTLTAAPTPTLTAAIAVTATNSKTPIPTWTPFPTKALTSTPLSIPSQPMQTTVSSTTGWQSTDVFIAKGTRINIEVVSGQWTQTKGKVPYNPGLGNQNYSCANYMPANQCVEPLPDAPQGALIGKIGNFIFEIDDGVIITASESGILFLRINDGDVGLYDNDGTLVVRVTLN